MAKKVDPHRPSGQGSCACKGHWHHNLPDWSPRRRFSPAGSAKLVPGCLQYNTYCRHPPRLRLVPSSSPRTRPNHATIRSAGHLTIDRMGSQIVKKSGARAQVVSQSGIVPKLGLNGSAQVILWSALLSSPRPLPSNAETGGMHWGALLVWCRLGCVEWIPLDWRKHKCAALPSLFQIQ